MKNYCLSKIRERKVQSKNIRMYIERKRIVGNRRVLSSKKINSLLYSVMSSGKPLLAGCFGATELFDVHTLDFKLKTKYNKALSQMQMCF